MPKMDLLTCTRCNLTWAQEETGGSKPRLCADCRAQPVPSQRTPESPPDRRTAHRLDETSEAYRLAAKQAQYISAMVLAYWALRQKKYDLAEQTLLEAIPPGQV